MKQMLKADEAHGLGATATLDKSGYSEVLALKSDAEMRNFIIRVAHSCQLKVVDEGGLTGAVPWFSGTTAEGSIENIKTALFTALLASSRDHWVSCAIGDGLTGITAQPDVVGFVQVRALKDADEMVTFARRLIENMGVRIIDEGGFQGVMKYYSDPYIFQSFYDLQKEIKRAANTNSWAQID